VAWPDDAVFVGVDGDLHVVAQGGEGDPKEAAWAEEQLAADPQLRAAQLAGPIEDAFGVRAHPRSIERALARYRECHPKSR
jgi:hypothetical protein